MPRSTERSKAPKPERLEGPQSCLNNWDMRSRCMEIMNTAKQCGRYTKAKHIETAKHVFWRRDICTPVLRLR
eukprot:15958990-Heterocapsa_arctica.AAC.1